MHQHQSLILALIIRKKINDNNKNVKADPIVLQTIYIDENPLLQIIYIEAIKNG